MSSVAEVRKELDRINKHIDEAKKNHENTRAMLAKDAARLQEAIGDSSQSLSHEVLNDLTAVIQEFPKLDAELSSIQEKAREAGKRM